VSAAQEKSNLRLALVSMSQISAPDYVPELVLYSDGTMVRWDRGRQEFQSCRVTEPKAMQLANSSKLKSLKREYRGSTVLEGRGWRLVFRDGGAVRWVSADEHSPDAEPFHSVRRRLLNFRCPKPEVWFPARTELVFFPVGDDLPRPLVDYPRDWPAPTKGVSRYPELAKPALHAFLDGSRFYELKRRVEARTAPVERDVRIEGGKCVVRLRAPMRFEELWYGVPPDPDQQHP